MMDAMKFFEERDRMCFAHPIVCNGCPLSEKFIGICLVWCVKHPEEAIAVVEQWAKEHPVKTRQSEFLKHYPGARIDQNTGVLDICPMKIFGSATKINCNVQPCFACEAKFWLAEIE